jgi:hypothetical protein
MKKIKIRKKNEKIETSYEKSEIKKKIILIYFPMFLVILLVRFNYN